jgi:hypothetical protein
MIQVQEIMSGDNQQNGAPEYPYETPDEPRKLTDDDLAFLSRYTGEKDLDKLRNHVISVWKSVKSKVRG